MASLQAACIPVLWDNTTPGLPPPALVRANNEESPGPSIPLPQYERQRGREDNNTPLGDAILPRHYRVFRNTQNFLQSLTNRVWNLSGMRGSQSPRPREQEQPQNYREIFCCISRMYTEPLETILQIIIREKVPDDEKFYEAFNKAIRDAAGPWLAGWLRRLFSWKSCTAIEFVEASLP